MSDRMFVTVNKPIEVEPTTMEVLIKCRDDFFFIVRDSQGNNIAHQDDGYVPDFFPGRDSDYLELQIDVRTGKILNWPNQKDFIAALQDFITDQEKNRG